MKNNFDNVTWTALEDVPWFNGVLPDTPCGFERETYSVDGVVTHYRFVPICGRITRFPVDSEE